MVQLLTSTIINSPPNLNHKKILERLNSSKSFTAEVFVNPLATRSLVEMNLISKSLFVTLSRISDSVSQYDWYGHERLDWQINMYHQDYHIKNMVFS
jgi:hypothetical protein